MPSQNFSMGAKTVPNTLFAAQPLVSWYIQMTLFTLYVGSLVCHYLAGIDWTFENPCITNLFTSKKLAPASMTSTGQSILVVTLQSNTDFSILWHLVLDRLSASVYAILSFNVYLIIIYKPSLCCLLWTFPHSAKGVSIAILFECSPSLDNENLVFDTCLRVRYTLWEFLDTSFYLYKRRAPFIHIRLVVWIRLNLVSLTPLTVCLFQCAKRHLFLLSGNRNFCYQS